MSITRTAPLVVGSFRRLVVVVAVLGGLSAAGMVANTVRLQRARVAWARSDARALAQVQVGGAGIHIGADGVVVVDVATGAVTVVVGGAVVGHAGPIRRGLGPGALPELDVAGR